jgi:hypothetical protein
VSVGRKASRKAKTRAREHSKRAPNPLHGGSLSDTLHNIACALAYLNIAEVPEDANDDLVFGRFLLVDTVLQALEALVP